MTEQLPPTSRPSRPSGAPDESRLRALADSLRAEVDEDALRNDDLRYLAAARETLTLWGEWWGPGRPVSVPRNMEVKLRAVYPLALHALNCVAISLDMHERLPWVATALARVAFEHALEK